MRLGTRGLCRVCGEGQGSFRLRSPSGGTTTAATKLSSRSQRNDLFLRSDKRSVAPSFSSPGPSVARRFFLGGDSAQAREARLSSAASSSRPLQPQRRTLFGWGKAERNPIPVVTKEELMEKLRRKHEGKPGSDFVLLDVRESEELHHLGWIDTAHNVPYPQLYRALQLSDEEWEEEFGFPKPKAEDEIICYCRTGMRSAYSCETLSQHGFKNVKNYKGSMAEWEKP